MACRIEEKTAEELTREQQSQGIKVHAIILVDCAVLLCRVLRVVRCVVSCHVDAHLHVSKHSFLIVLYRHFISSVASVTVMRVWMYDVHSASTFAIFMLRVIFVPLLYR